MSSKQDRQGVRTPANVEQKYGLGDLGKNFSNIMGIAQESRKTAQEALAESKKQLTSDEVFNILTNNGANQGLYRGEDGELYINASYIKSGELLTDLLKSGIIRSKDGTVKLDLNSNEVTIDGGEALNTDYGYNWMRKSKISVSSSCIKFYAEKSPDNLELVHLATIGMNGNGLYIKYADSDDHVVFVNCNGGNGVVLGSENSMTIIEGADIRIGEKAIWSNSDVGYNSSGLYDGSGYADFGSFKICWGQMAVKYAATTAASGSSYYGDSTSISGGTFKKAFYDPPAVTLTVRQGTTSMLEVEAVSVSTTGINKLRIHRANSYTDTTGVLVDYIAIGI